MIDRFGRAAPSGTALSYDANTQPQAREGFLKAAAWTVTVEMRVVLALVAGPVALVTGAWETPLGLAIVWAVISAGSRSYIRYQGIHAQ